MRDGVDEELAALRKRAYGADADIRHDPAALARLAELERLHRNGHVPQPATPPTPAPAPPPRPLIAASTVAAAASGSAPGPRSPAAPPPAAHSAAPAADPAGTAAVASGAEPAPPGWTRRRVALTCALAAVAGAAIAVPSTLWISGLTAQPYAVLHVTDQPVNTGYFGEGTDGRRFDDILGMRVSVGEVPTLGDCIIIETTATDQSGVTRGGCSAPGFSPIFDLPLLDGFLPAEGRVALGGDATGLRFMLVGDEVQVFVGYAPEDSPES